MSSLAPSSAKTRRAALPLAILATALACATPRATSGPLLVPVDDPTAAYGKYLAAQSAALNYRHQVETTFLGRTEVLEGLLTLRPPERFTVQAMTPLGGTLFAVDGDGGRVHVRQALAEVDDPRAPYFLARDIRRVYLTGCPTDAPVQLDAEGLATIRCDVPKVNDPGAPPLDDGADTSVLLRLSGAGVLVDKCFFRDSEATACIRYEEYQNYDATVGRWLPTRITLEHGTQPYRLVIALLDVERPADVGAANAVTPAAQGPTESVDVESR